MEFRILGPMEVAAEDGAVVRLPSGRARVVLAMLCMEAGGQVSSDRLIDLAWNGNPPATSGTQLHGLISSLRRALARPGTRSSPGPDGYGLGADVDLARMRELITLARHGLEGGNLDEAAAIFGDALALWRGRPFTGLDCGDLATSADLIEQEYVGALEDYAETELRRGKHAMLTQRLAVGGRLPVARKPARSYIIALARSGRQAEAIATYHQLRRHLAEDLGVDPGRACRRCTSRSSPAISTRRDRCSQAGSAPGRERATSPAGPNRSRRYLTRWPATSPPAALVISAVSGIGGIGKSALAVHVAHRAAAVFPDGQLYVNLAGASASLRSLPRCWPGCCATSGCPPVTFRPTRTERAARYRPLAGPGVIVLDDARDAAQVRPLLRRRRPRSSSPAGLARGSRRRAPR